MKTKRPLGEFKAVAFLLYTYCADVLEPAGFQGSRDLRCEEPSVIPTACLSQRTSLYGPREYLTFFSPKNLWRSMESPCFSFSLGRNSGPPLLSKIASTVLNVYAANDIFSIRWTISYSTLSVFFFFTTNKVRRSRPQLCHFLLSKILRVRFFQEMRITNKRISTVLKSRNPWIRCAFDKKRCKKTLQIFLYILLIVLSDSLFLLSLLFKLLFLLSAWSVRYFYNFPLTKKV